ncbi:MAG: hypothetical protein K2X93_10360 [Candidatus Obscuribacterales bacterium]|nr:hypothetical protein [Candidatus Obscuribacterales bacterium]
MKINQIKAFAIKLPFRFSFGHSLASRNSSLNAIVRVELEDDKGRRIIGYGESVPRDYVTGETIEGALKDIREIYAPRLLNETFSSPLDALIKLKKSFEDLSLHEKPKGASWCAVELAVLDAVSRANSLSIASLLSAFDAVRLSQTGTLHNAIHAASVSAYATYGGVVPFSGKASLVALLLFFKAYGFKTVKIKVGRDWEKDLERLELARSIMGEDVILRIDANCAWTVEETLYFAERMRDYKIASIEQPVPSEDLAGMQRLTREIPECIVADESLLTVKDARTLIEVKGANAFNIRLSKVGGLASACEIVDLARANGIGCLLGAQVGESAILSAAGRAFACVKGPFDNCEGSFNRFLLKSDLSIEDTTIKRGGRAYLPDGKGFGITINESKLKRLVVKVPEVSASYVHAAGA